MYGYAPVQINDSIKTIEERKASPCTGCKREVFGITPRTCKPPAKSANRSVGLWPQQQNQHLSS